jgi:hypothetical protein
MSVGIRNAKLLNTLMYASINDMTTSDSTEHPDIQLTCKQLH